MDGEQNSKKCLLDADLDKQSVISQVGNIVARLPDGDPGRFLVGAVALKPTVLGAGLQEDRSVVVALIPGKH